MKKSNHTPEPWGPDLGPIDKDYYIEPMTLLTTRDYKRARACVNACAGINPEAVPDLLAAAKLAFKNMFGNTEAWVALRDAIAKAEGRS